MPGPTRPMSDNAAIVAGLAELLARAEPLMSHNYVVVEALALVQHRLGAVGTPTSGRCVSSGCKV